LKKVLIIFLAILLLLQSGGLFHTLKINQILIKLAQNTILKYAAQDSETLTLSIDEYLRCKINNNEILYNEKMFDIVSKDVVKNNVILKVVQDDFEIEISNFIKKFVSKEKRNDDNIALSYLLHLIYIPTSFIFKFQSDILAKSAKGYIVKNLSDLMLKIELPPPKG
jgi:hypothetical protein